MYAIWVMANDHSKLPKRVIANDRSWPWVIKLMITLVLYQIAVFFCITILESHLMAHNWQK